MDISDIVNYGTVAVWIGSAALYVGRLIRGEAEIPKWLPKRLSSNVVLGITIALGLVGSAAQWYLHYRTPPKVVVVEKPVDRIVEKTVTVPCPKPKQSAPGIEVQSGAHVEGTANAPNSMATGINTGTMMQGDVTPQFTKSVTRSNERSDGMFATTFSVEVTSNHTFVMKVVATGDYIAEFRVAPEIPAGAPGTAVMILNKMVSSGRAYGSVQNVSSGKYFVTVMSTQPDNVELKVSN